ncbi:hypothetical protein [Microcoleus sp. AT3-D2]|uniref:hypothetical protein n=1 Tax=Microcoleus sp. AT3-D2 TaxID=2818612 RepID=UPI002FD0D93D
MPLPDRKLPVAAILVDRDYCCFFNAIQKVSKVLAFQGEAGESGRGNSDMTKTEVRLCHRG